MKCEDIKMFAAIQNFRIKQDEPQWFSRIDLNEKNEQIAIKI